MIADNPNDAEHGDDPVPRRSSFRVVAMSVYFVYRSFDHHPTGKFLKRFDDDTVLAWFQRNWEYVAVDDQELADERLTEVVGCSGWFLWNPFWTAIAHNIPRPTTAKALLALLRRCMGEGPQTFEGSPHCLQIFTEEDGEGGALYYFDDHFLKRSGGLATYLLNEDWRLPSGDGEKPFKATVNTYDLQPRGSGVGTTYFVPLERNSKYPLDDAADAYRIEGLRLPELAQHLCRLPPQTHKENDFPGNLRQLPALMLAGVKLADRAEATFLKAIQANPGEGSHWAAWSDWRQEHDMEPPGIALLRDAFKRMAKFPQGLQDTLPTNPDVVAACRRLTEMEKESREKLRKKLHSLIHVENHFAQMCLDGSRTDEPYFGQWILFDDLWAGAHSDMANSLLRYSARWDVLTPDTGKRGAK